MTGDSDSVEEELEALSAIYGDEFFIIEPENRLKAQWMHRSQLGKLTDIIDELIRNSDGSPIVYSLVETIRSYLQTEFSNDAPDHSSFESGDALSTGQESVHNPHSFKSVPTVKAHLDITPSKFPMTSGFKAPHTYHGEPFVDRKSVFQAHCARVTCLEEVSLFISELLEDRKVAAATHNILAWRIVKKGKDSNIMSDCDDDGETHAGGRLLHLLTLSEAENIAVMVSRWYGGIQLGPDRFKHINNVARLLLVEQNFLSRSNEAADKGHKHKGKKNKTASNK